MKKLFFLILIYMLFFAFMASQTISADTTNLRTIAMVRPKIKISATSMNFGNIDDAGTYLASAIITVKAPVGTSFNIAIDAGLHYSGGSRQMKKTGKPDNIPYQIFKDPGYSMQWGDSDFDNTFPHGSSLSGISTGPKTEFIAYGRVILQEAPAYGFYIDMLTVTIHY
jgi:spore coat protein U-like protein